MAVPVEIESVLTVGPPQSLSRGSYRTSAGLSRYYDVAPDGERFVMVEFSGAASGRSEIPVVQNWHQELLERVPVP